MTWNSLPARFLKEAKNALGERRLLIMLDEFEVLEGRIRSGDLKPRILSYFRSLMQHEQSVSFIFSGSADERDCESGKDFEYNSARRRA